MIDKISAWKISFKMCFFCQVTFASPSEADLAMTSTEAVMGNRFIKVFYHNESKNASVPLKDRIGGKPTVSIVHMPAELTRHLNWKN